MAIVTACGAECGIVTAGLASTTNRHWTKGSGTPAIETTVVRTGARSYKMAAASGVNPYLARTCVASQTVGYQRSYFRMDALPSAATPSTTTPDIIYFFNSGTTAGDGTIRIGNSGVISACWGGTVIQSGPTLAANTWYGIEVECDVSVNPNVLRWRVWDAVNGWRDQTNATLATAAQTLTDMEFGQTTGSGNGAHPTSGWNLYFDDILMGEGTVIGGDYSTTRPRGGTVPRLLPTSDGTHSFTANDFIYNAAGGSILVSATDVYTYVDDGDQTSIADFINQAITRTTGYCAIAFADPTESAIGVIAVTSTMHAATTSAETGSVRISDNAWVSETAVWALLDTSDTSAHFLHKVVATPPSGGSWTTAKLASTQLRMGYSDDATPDVYFDSHSIEYEAPYVSMPLPRRNRHMLIR